MTPRASGLLGLFRAREAPTDRSYECTHCGTTFGEWPGACADCGQLVVRVAEPRPVPDL